MIVEIMSKAKAVEASFKVRQEKVAVISIADADKVSPQLFKHPGNGIFRQLQVRFADVDADGLNGMSDEQANQIARYVLDVCNMADRLIVHCEAGISRSAGVGAAIMKFLYGDDKAVFNSPSFCPNMTCYRKVLNALHALAG